MTTAPLHTPATIHVVNPDAEPTDTWIRAIAVLLLADVDRERLESKHLEEQGEVRHGHHTTRTQ